MLRGFILAAIILYVGAIGALLADRRALIYPLSQRFDAAEAYGISGLRAAEIAGADGVPVFAWVKPPVPGQPVVMHFTGNVGWLPNAARRMRVLAEAGYGIAILNYRGAGGAPGEPSEDAIAADARALYDALPRLLGPTERPPVVYGVSLGAAVAVRLAAERPVSGVVLLAPFARLCRVAQHHYPWVPACLIQWDERWDSLDRIAAIDAPLLILHGEGDRVVPVTEGRALFAAAAEPKELILYPGAGHRDLGRYGADRAVEAFVGALPR